MIKNSLNRLTVILTLSIFLWACSGCSSSGLFGLNINIGDKYDDVFRIMSKNQPNDTHLSDYSKRSREYFREEIKQRGEMVDLYFPTSPFYIDGIKFNGIYPVFNRDLELVKITVLRILSPVEDGNYFYDKSKRDYEQIISYFQRVYPGDLRTKENERVDKIVQKTFSVESGYTLESFLTQTDSIAIEHSYSKYYTYNGSYYVCTPESNASISISISHIYNPD